VTIKYIEHKPKVIDIYKGVVKIIFVWNKNPCIFEVSIESILGLNFLLLILEFILNEAFEPCGTVYILLLARYIYLYRKNLKIDLQLKKYY
jgi:hypothetical protein